MAEGELVGARLTGYRWHVPDPIPFTKSLWAGIEHAGWTYNADGTLRSGFEERPDYFSSVAFWYQKGVNEGLAGAAVMARRACRWATRCRSRWRIRIADVTTTKGKASVQREVDWGRDLLFFEAEGRARASIFRSTFRKGAVRDRGRIAQAPDYGDYYALLDGKPTNWITARR